MDIFKKMRRNPKSEGNYKETEQSNKHNSQGEVDVTESQRNSMFSSTKSQLSKVDSEK